MVASLPACPPVSRPKDDDDDDDDRRSEFHALRWPLPRSMSASSLRPVRHVMALCLVPACLSPSANAHLKPPLYISSPHSIHPLLWCRHRSRRPAPPLAPSEFAVLTPEEEKKKKKTPPNNDTGPVLDWSAFRRLCHSKRRSIAAAVKDAKEEEEILQRQGEAAIGHKPVRQSVSRHSSSSGRNQTIQEAVAADIMSECSSSGRLWQHPVS